MFKYNVIILFFVFQPIFAMHDLHLAVMEQRKIHELDSLLEKKEKMHKSINLTLLRFDQLSEFLLNRSPEETVKLHRHMSQDMRSLCDVARLHKDVGGCIHACMVALHQQNSAKFAEQNIQKNKEQKECKNEVVSIRNFCLNMMFDGNPQTIDMFEHLEADQGLRLYHESKSAKDFGKAIERLMLASQEDRTIILNLFKQSIPCYPHPIITHCYKEKIDAINQDLYREYLAEKKVLVCFNCDKIEQDWGRGACMYTGFFIPLFLTIAGGGIGAFAAICTSHACMHNCFFVAAKSAGGCGGVACAAAAAIAICKSTEEVTL